MNPTAQAVIDAAVAYKNACMEFIADPEAQKPWAARVDASVALVQAVSAYEREQARA